MSLKFRPKFIAFVGTCYKLMPYVVKGILAKVGIQGSKRY